MNGLEYNIIDWDESFAEKALELEKSNVQGKSIQLEIVKKHFLDRARVFENYYGCLAVRGDKLIGSAIGAETSMLINKEQVRTGFGLDAKVHPEVRNNGIGKELAKALYSNFFKQRSLSKNIMTAKLVNQPVHKMVNNAIGDTSVFPFIYMSIPATSRIKRQKTGRSNPVFKVGLFDEDKLASSYFTTFSSGLGCFYTNKLYAVRIKKISWPLKTGIWLMKNLNAAKYHSLPNENATIFFATLYNHTKENIHGINEVLEHLEAKGIGQLMVCCQVHDEIYQALKNYSINTYNYCIRADFMLDKSDNITIDVRCL